LYAHARADALKGFAGRRRPYDAPEQPEFTLHTTDDPLVDGPIAPPPGATVNDPGGRSAVEPFPEAVD
jgi:Adenylylsulphate kinase